MFISLLSVLVRFFHLPFFSQPHPRSDCMPSPFLSCIFPFNSCPPPPSSFHLPTNPLNILPFSLSLFFFLTSDAIYFFFYFYLPSFLRPPPSYSHQAISILNFLLLSVLLNSLLPSHTAFLFLSPLSSLYSSPLLSLLFLFPVLNIHLRPPPPTPSWPYSTT